MKHAEGGGFPSFSNDCIRARNALTAGRVLAAVLAEHKRFAVCAFRNGRVFLVCADADSLESAVVTVVSVVCALCYRAEDGMIGLLLVIHDMIRPFLVVAAPELSASDISFPQLTELFVFFTETAAAPACRSA